MGRLTLNMLLSFAQFEREVTGERIRDKIAASKKKGMWMGGIVPLGYQAVDRTLVINEDEAQHVRTLFRLYIELGRVRSLREEAERQGKTTRTGKPYSRGHLHAKPRLGIPRRRGVEPVSGVSRTRQRGLYRQANELTCRMIPQTPGANIRPLGLRRIRGGARSRLPPRKGTA